MARLAGLASLSVRTILAVIMTAHGWQKPTQMGPAGFGQGYGQMGIPLPGLMGFVVTFVEMVGGILLMAAGYCRGSPPWCSRSTSPSRSCR